jgi:perosamine synthetase
MTDSPAPRPIAVNTPLLGDRERELLLECVNSGWISSEGPFVAQLEERFATRVARKHGVAVANGTAALEIAVRALDLGPGDEVIMPSFTIISPALAVLRSGATPVLTDVDPVTWNMDANGVAARITPRTRAIIVVHIYGLPVDIDPILQLAAKHGLAVIEDAAEMHGQTYAGRPCGSFGALSTFSFYANKLVATGEGGMVVTDDPMLAARCRSLRNLCLGTGAKRFVHEDLGWNYRMTNLQAALGLAQLERLDLTLARKRMIGKRYDQLFADLTDVQLPLARTGYAQSCYWVYGIVLGDRIPFAADELMDRLAARGVGTRPFFWPMHEQPVLLRRGLFAGEQHSVSSRLARRGLYVPASAGTTDEEVERVALEVRSAIEH